MQYPLREKIGVPELLVGREKEFSRFNKWIDNIPRTLSKSRVILARRKSGKTSFIQRIFNELWNDTSRGVIPFYFDITENKIWYPDLAMKYYRTFASHYISYLERDSALIDDLLTLEKIRAYGVKKSIEPLVSDVDLMLQNKEVGGSHGQMWQTAYSAPHRFASRYDLRFLVMIDEFQNIAQYVYPDQNFETKPIESMPGSFHYHSESKVAPMLVTGSYVGWLLNIISKYLEAGRLTEITFSPYLEPDEGIEAVYRYAEVYREPITHQAALQINELCMADPFFIASVIQSEYDDKDLTTTDGVVETVNYEITDRRSEMFRTWGEYIQMTLKRVNDVNAKNILLYLSQNSEHYFRPQDLKDELNLDMGIYEIQEKLLHLVESDVIERGTSDIRFRGLRDGTLNLILRSRFQEEITGFMPDLGREFHEKIKELESDKRSLKGRISYLEGMVAEQLLATEFRTRKRFHLSEYFTGIKDDRKLNLVEVRTNVIFHRSDGKREEIDLIARAQDGLVLMIEVRKREKTTGRDDVEDLWDNMRAYVQVTDGLESVDDVVPAFLSFGGFTKDALEFCEANGIGTAEKMTYL